MANTEEPGDRSFETEREQFEEKHRNEILNLLKSFEFEKKDMETRFQEELERRENEKEKYEEDVETEGFELKNSPRNGDQNDLLRLEETEQKIEFEEEKKNLLIRISELERMIQKQGENDGEYGDVGSSGTVVLPKIDEHELGNEEINRHNFDPTQNSSTNDLKSLSELETENKKLEEKLNKSRDQILELKNHIKDFTRKIEDIEKLLEDSDFPADKKEILSHILQGAPRDTSSPHDVFPSPGNSPEPQEKSLDDVDTSFTATKHHRTSSVLSFQLEELNLENEDLKRNVYELEQKLRKTVEENEVRVGVLNEKLHELSEKLMSGENSEAAQESDFKLTLVEDIDNIRLHKTSSELLEEYVSIVLKQKLTAPSPDILNVNFCHELQSLEQILDIEIFDGRVFDSEMKDEVKQVLRDKEKELLVAYTLEKLRDEIRHRATTEGTLEELQRERERDFCVHQAVNEILKAHLGVSDDNMEHEGNDNQEANGVSQVHLGTSKVDDDAVNKILKEHLGIGKDSNLLEDSGVGRRENQSSATDIESLKTEKENLERNLQELQEYFEKERQAWLEKMERRLQGDSNDPEDKDKVIESLQARTVLMEQILNTERFHLSRLYYMEMKEELEMSLKQHPFDRGTKLEKDRLVDAWKHHVEVGELYQEILSKETENLQNLQEFHKPQNDEQNDSPRHEVSKERSRLEQQLPVKLELLQLQQRRCRDHKAASLILEQAVVALETAAQEQDTLLVSGDYFRRKSSWSSVEEVEEGSEVPKEVSPHPGEEETNYKDIPSVIGNADIVGNSSRKDGLANALVKAFERLLNGQQESNVAQVDSCTSDSELSEVETSSSRDVHSDDEGSAKNQDPENASSANNSPRTEPKTTDDPESQPETHDDTSVPVVFKLPPRIENILNIERFNMSRLLRDEYVDKIRRGRHKLRRARAKNEEKNGELVSKFQDEVKVLLEGVEIGEKVEEGLPPQRPKLTATPSYDSGIADPVEQDKEDVVKKYKELLEKARRDLSRAHRALRARNVAEGGVKDEMAAMKKDIKEVKNDLEELEDKRNDLNHDRGALLGKIKDAQNPTSMDNEEQSSREADVSELERDHNIPLDSTPHEQSDFTNEDGKEASNADVDRESVVQNDGHSPGGSFEKPASKSDAKTKDIDKMMEEMENKVKKLCEEKMDAEEEIRELQRKLVAGTGGEDVLKDLQEKLADAKDQKAKLEEKCSELENEMVEKDESFEVAMKAKEEEVSELQRDLVAGIGGEDVLNQLKGKVQKAKDEKLEVEEKCSGLEKEIKEKEERLRKAEEEIEKLERKSVEGTGAEEVVEKLHEKLNETKAEKEKVEKKFDEVEKRNKKLSDMMKNQEKEINELQKKLVAGSGGEEILKDLQGKLEEADEQNSRAERNSSDLQQEIENMDKKFSGEKTKMDKEVNDLQRKLVAGTGGEEILKELQEKIQEAKEQNSSLEESNSELEKELERKDQAFSDEVEVLKEEINELQRKLVAGTGGEEILDDLQKKLNEADGKNGSLEQRNSDLQAEIRENQKTSCDKEKALEDEINSLQRKLVDGTGGEEILAELQDKRKKAKDENAALQAKCEELEGKSRAKDEKLGEEIKRKENEIIDLQRKLVDGTGREEILAELQDKLKKARDGNAALEEKCKGLEDKVEEKNKRLSDRIAEQEGEISELQKKMVSGTGGEEILNELQDKLKEVREEKTALQTTTDNLESKIKTKDEEHADEIKGKQNEINDLQKKLISGTGGEEILADLQDKLEQSKAEKTALKRKCDDLEDKEMSRNKDIDDQIKFKNSEIDDLQKKLISGTGVEAVLIGLQDKLKETTKEKVALQTRCEELEDMAREKDNEFDNEIKEKENEISDLQKKLVSGTGGEEVLAELRNKLKETKEENVALKATCSEFEKSAGTNENDLRDELEKKEHEIEKLQKQLVSGTGCEEMLNELQVKLKVAKEKNDDAEEECSKLQELLVAKDDQLNSKVEQKDVEIFELQQKLVSGSGAEEILGNLQKKLKDSEKEKSMLEERCSELSKEVKLKDKELNNQKNENDEKVNDLQRKLIAGTGSEEVLEELQNKLKGTEMEKEIMNDKCSKLQDEIKKKDREAREERNKKDEEINKLQKKMLSGTCGEEILEELQEKLKEAEMENEILKDNYSKLKDEVKERDVEEKIEKAKRDEQINKLQKSLISGTGGEEVLDELQEKVKHTEKEKQKLERTCAELDRDLKKKDQELQRKEDEVNNLQKSIVAGTGAEDLLKELQEKLRDAKESEKASKERLSGLESDLQTKDEKYAKQLADEQLFVVQKENENLANENESKDEEIRELQKMIADGSGAEELLKTLQDKIKEAKQENKVLKKKYSELERDTAVISEDNELLQQRVLDLAEAENENEILARDCKEKDRHIVELQRKVVAGTGGEEVLEELQNQVKQLQGINNELERKLAKTTRNAGALEGLKRKENGRESGRNNLREGSSFTTRRKGKDIPSKGNANNDQDKNDEVFAGPLHHRQVEMVDEEIDEPISYEQCLQMIPEIKEEKDYWREKYKALRRKVGPQFVDTIPDVWNEETLLEKEREEIEEELAKLRREITERGTPAVKAVSEKERIETELSRVENDLGVCSGNLRQLRDMRNEHKLIEKNEGMMMECLNELQLLDDSVDEGSSKGKETEDVTGAKIEELDRKLEGLYNEVEELLTEEQNLKDLKEKEINCLVDEKISTENDVQEIEAAIQNLKQDFSTPNGFNRQREMAEESKGISDELEKIQGEIDILQSSFGSLSLSNGQEINNLLALMKEKSKLEDELADTEKSLNQLGKREYEALVKERETHETVARKLLELSREQEAVEGELQEVEALVQEKEGELVKSYNTELKSREDLNTPTKRRGFRKKKSRLEIKSEDSGAVSSAEERFSDIDLEEPALTSDAVLALNEELGPLIQKQSSLGVRLEGLRKGITAQSLKVEKSLLGVKDYASGEASLGAGYASVEDLTQSQMSIFDDYNMVDELSLATNIVRDERVKRKSSRKAPLSKLLKEKSTLEKKLKEFQGKVLVQNTKVKNALKEGQDAGKAKDKFVKAVEDRKSAENELTNVSRKIDAITLEDSSLKDKKRKTPKSGKSLSKNDKRRLLSQRESLSKQLEAIKKKIENFSVDGQDSGLADFPEMRETENTGTTIERLRELIAREAVLKHELDRQALMEGPDLLSESAYVSSSTAGRDGSEEMLNKRGEIGENDDRNVYTKGSGMISDSCDSSSLDEGILDSGDELGKRGDENRDLNEVGTSSVPGPLGESFDNKGMLKERFKDLGNQVRNASEEQEADDGSFIAQAEVDSNTNVENGKASLLEKDAQSQEDPTVLPQTRISNDTMLSSEQDGKIRADYPAPYANVMDLLVKEKVKKEARLRDLEKQIENKKNDGEDTEDSNLVCQRKRQDLKNKMKLALNELQQRKEVLDESENLLKTTTNESEQDPEQVLENDHIALTQQKEKLETDLAAVKEKLVNQTQSEHISTDYQDYKDAKDKEQDLVEALDKVNEKLHQRKEWTAVDGPGREDDSNLAEAYADILKRMSDENLNMADLIHEMEETKETLSKEREITSELLDLIKSRVGNELLEALMRESLQSPSAEIREMGMFSGEGYLELLDEVENDTVTVAEVIDDYKKVNQFLFKENQKLHEKVELLKTKVDEDLLASIVNEEPLNIELSKKQEISKILENNKTLFEQIVSNRSEEVVLNTEDEVQSVNTEIEGVRKEKKENIESDLNRMKQKVKGISTELGEASKKREELVQKLKELEKDSNSSTSPMSGEERIYSTVKDDGSLNKFNASLNEVYESMQSEKEIKEVDVSEETVGSLTDESNDFQNVVDLAKEKDELRSNDPDKILQEISSRLKEAEALETKMDSELERLYEDLGETETETAEDVDKKDQAMKQRDESGSELNKQHENPDPRGSKEHEENNRHYDKDNRGYGEDDLESNEDHKQDNEGLKEKISSVENLQKEFLAKLDEVEKLQEKLKRETEFKAKTQELENKLDEAVSRLTESNKERNQTLGELENLKKEKEKIEDRLSLVEHENIELKESMADLENGKEELTSNVNESNRAKDEIAAELKNVEKEKEVLQEMVSSLEKENDEIKEKISDLRNENEEILARLNKENDKKEFAKTEGELQKDNKSLKDLQDAQKEENEKLAKEIRELQTAKDELCVKVNDADKIRQEDVENYQEKIGTLENENKELGEVILALKRENEEGIEKLNEINETIKENEERLKSLQDLEQENESLKERLDCLENETKDLEEKMRDYESIKEMMASLESENNEIIPTMERLEKLTKEQEDEIDYLRKEEKDFQLLNEKLKEVEADRENLKEDLGVLNDDLKEIEDFVRQDMNQDVGNGVFSALDRYREKYEETNNQNNLVKEKLERMKQIQNVVGERLFEKLLELPKEELMLNDTQDIPRCVEEVIKDKNTLASVLNEYENDLDKVRQHLGKELFSLAVGKEANSEGEESDLPVKMADDLKNGKHIKEIIEEYEDLINSQVNDLETAEHLQEQVNKLEQELEAARKQRDELANQNEPDSENVDSKLEDEVKPFEAVVLQAAEDGDQIPKSNQGYENDSLMDIEYEDLLKKVMEHQAEIEEAEKLLHVQKAQHEADKQNMIEQFNAEKASMQQLLNNERCSMEKAMQNLINEIVRLKEERNEIRKNNRIEKEKLVSAFENERTEWLSSNEEMKNEIEGKLEKRFHDDFEKVKKEMATRETELKEEIEKLKGERNDLASKVSEMEDKVGDEISGREENEKLSFSKETGTNEHIRNEFEEKMKVEKKRFQETLNSLRQEIERLQKERSKAVDEISTRQEDFVKQTADVSASEAVIYDRLESEFRTKMNSEKMFMESRIKELRKENEVLNKQKQELKSSMRIERLELSKKYEKEKEELAEKYRNELKTLRKNLEKTQASHEASTPSTQNFYELRRKIRDRDSKIQRYETFFKELNQEASILQQDSDLAV